MLDLPAKPRQLFGCSPLHHYELLDQVGEGTFGVVNKGRVRVAPVYAGGGEVADVKGKGPERPRARVNDIVALKRIILHNENDGVRTPRLFTASV
jgi:hypothetical protein